MRVHNTFTGRPFSAVASVASLAGLMMITAVSIAQAQPSESITVAVPRSVRQTVITGRASATNAPIEETTITRTVSYSDLDLTKTADANELKARVEIAAKDVCTELDHLYPFEDKDRACARKSAEEAMVRVNAAIAEATQQ